MITPLPFDGLPMDTTALLERLEKFDSKAYLMTYIRLDTAGIRASLVRDVFMKGFPYSTWDNEWEAWKAAIVQVTGKTWEEIAPIIYEGF